MTDIIIPVFSKSIPDRFYDCLRALFKNTNDFRLITVSSDQSQPKNVNTGLTRANSPYIAILDWDVIVPPRWLKILTQNLKDDESIGIIGAKMVGDYIGTNRNAELGVQTWDTLAGGCMVFNNFGLKFDERFPSGYWADTDFCRQFKDLGYGVAINGDVEVEHYPNTFGTNPEKVAYWSKEGEKIYKKKWGDLNF